MHNIPDMTGQESIMVESEQSGDGSWALDRYGIETLTRPDLEDKLTDEEYLLLGMLLEAKVNPGGRSLKAAVEQMHDGGVIVTPPDKLLSSLISKIDALSDDIAMDPDWQKNALCAQTDPEAFFPDKGGSTREAKRVCAACPVSAECLHYAIDNDERFGIWGGLSERERRRLKKKEL